MAHEKSCDGPVVLGLCVAAAAAAVDGRSFTPVVVVRDVHEMLDALHATAF